MFMVEAAEAKDKDKDKAKGSREVGVPTTAADFYINSWRESESQRDRETERQRDRNRERDVWVLVCG